MVLLKLIFNSYSTVYGEVTDGGRRGSGEVSIVYVQDCDSNVISHQIAMKNTKMMILDMAPTQVKLLPHWLVG